MIDYLCIEIKIDVEKLLSNPILTFSSSINERTGEVLVNKNGYFKRVAQLGNLEILINTKLATNKSKVTLKGSIHKYSQQNTNYNDFTLEQFKTSVYELCNTLQIEPISCLLHGFEYGVNINTHHATNSFLNSIISHKGKEYEKREFNSKGYLKSFHYSHHFIKIYDKGKQYNIDSNILRYELHIERMQYLHKRDINIVTLNDLLKPKIHNRLLKLLIDNIDNMYFYDYRINIDKVQNKSDIKVLLQGANPTFWKQYKESHSATAYKKKLKRYKELITKFAPSDLKAEFKTLVLDKWQTLIKSCPKLPHTENRKVAQSYPYIVGNISTPYPKRCLTCGKDISHQRNNSKYCRFKINGKENKDCKNHATNFFEHDLRLYPKHQLHLLEIDNYLQPELLRLKQIEFKKYRNNNTWQPQKHKLHLMK